MRGRTGGLDQEVLDIYKRTGIPNPLLFEAAMAAANDTHNCYTWELTQVCIFTRTAQTDPEIDFSMTAAR